MAGFSRGDITPPFPVRLYGYQSRKAYSEGVHDSISARVSVFKNGSRHFVLVSADMGSFGNDVINDLSNEISQRFHLDRSQLFIAATHSHSTPILSVNRETGDTANIRYTELLKKRLISLIDQAFLNMVAVNLSAGRGYSPVASNRREMRNDGTITLGRNPYGPADKEVLVLKVESEEGVPLAGIFDFSTHATSLGPRNMLISGDILGISAGFCEKVMAKKIIFPVFAGASGDIDPWYRVLPKFDTENGWIPEPVLLGTLLGEEVVHVFRAAKKLSDNQLLNTAEKTLEYPRRAGPESQKSQQKDKIPVRITAASIGDDVAFIGFNVEMLNEIGLKIKEASPFRYTFVITHCNGYSGYLPPLHLYKEGGYEVTTSPFEPGTAEDIKSEALKILNHLHSSAEKVGFLP